MRNTILSLIIAANCAACGAGTQEVYNESGSITVIPATSVTAPITGLHEFTDTDVESNAPNYQEPMDPIDSPDPVPQLPPPVVCGTLEGQTPCVITPVIGGK